MSRLLKRLGHDVIVANARHVRMIYGGDRKSDRLDAEALARLARLDPARYALGPAAVFPWGTAHPPAGEGAPQA